MPVDPLRTDWEQGDFVDSYFLNLISSRVNSLATGTGGTGGTGGTPVSRPNIFHIDDYGADPTGVNDSNQALIDAYAALAGGKGIIVFGVGTYKLFVGLNEASSRVLKPQQGIRGQGSGLTYIDYRGSDSCFEFRDRDFDNWAVNHQHGGCNGLTILGWNNGNSNTCGIRYGDQMHMRISDVEINGFINPGGKGLWGDNQYRFSERAFIECNVNQCTECFVFESNTGVQAFGPVGSFDYSQYWLSFVIRPDQHGFVLRSGTAGSKASMNGAEVTLTGNCQLSAVGQPNTGAMFRVGKDNNDEAGFSGTLRIGVETSGTVGGESHYDFMQGDGPFWQIKSRISATGTINLIPFSGANFKMGTASARTFAFAGMLKGSPSLGSTGNVQSFATLQTLGVARGGWYTDLTTATQTIYVTQATGGTFTLSYGGQTTSALAYNATPAQVESALQSLSPLTGNVTVWKGQARYINSVAVDETAHTVRFGGALVGTDVPLITANGAALTGTTPSVSVLMKSPGSTNLTYVFGLEGGTIFTIEPTPGTYRMRFATEGLTNMGVGASQDSPFGLTVVDIWVKQPDTGGPAIFEPPFFVPEPQSGSTYNFKWFDGQTPVLSTTPGFYDIIRLTTYNFSTWVGQHLTKQATAAVVPIRFSASTAAVGVTPTDYAYTTRTLTQARMRVSSAPVGSSLVAEVQAWSGATWTTLGSLTIVSGSQVEAILALNQSQAIGDLVRLNITSVGSTTAATGVVVDVLVS